MYVATDANGVPTVCTPSLEIMEWLGDNGVSAAKTVTFLHDYADRGMTIVDANGVHHYPMSVYTHAYRRLVTKP